MNSAKATENPVCPLCQGSQISLFMEIERVPVLCGVLWPSRQDAGNAATGGIQLGFCQSCGHIYNYAFKPELIDYTQHYDNSLNFSSRFQDYARSLATELIERFSLRQKAVVEIGCGDGAFLNLLCELGDNSGVGFEPGTDPQNFQTSSASKRIRFINDAYSDKYADIPADFVCCRHVLEHIPSPRTFLQTLGDMLAAKGGQLYFEVPNVCFNLGEHGLWDLIYEHCSYYGPSSLETLFRLTGFTVLNVEERYEGQFLTISASRDRAAHPELDSGSPDPGSLRDLVGTFQTLHKTVLDGWRRRLEQWRRAGAKIIVWGTGSKGVSFLNILETQAQIPYVVDINPRKQGMFVPGTGQEIKSPEFLKTYQPDVIIIMNRVYHQEIREFVNRLGLRSELLAV